MDWVSTSILTWGKSTNSRRLRSKHNCLNSCTRIHNRSLRAKVQSTWKTQRIITKTWTITSNKVFTSPTTSQPSSQNWLNRFSKTIWQGSSKMLISWDNSWCKWRNKTRNGLNLFRYWNNELTKSNWQKIWCMLSSLRSISWSGTSCLGVGRTRISLLWRIKINEGYWKLSLKMMRL